MTRYGAPEAGQTCLLDLESLTQLVGHAGIALFVLDGAGRLAEANAAWLAMHGYAEPGQVLGRPLAEFVGDEALVRDWLGQAESADCALARTGELGFRRADGSLGRALYTVCRRAAGRLEGLLVDVSARALAEERLREANAALRGEVAQRAGELKAAVRDLLRSKGSLRTLLENTREAVFVHGLDGRIVEVNAEMLRMYGATPEQARGADVTRFMGRDNPLEELPGYWGQAMRGEVVTFPWVGRRLDDGREFPVEVVMRGIVLEDGEFVLANVRDVTEAARAREQLELFGKVFENALEGITITDANGTILSVNPAFTSITGYSPEEALGQNPRILRSDRHDREFYRAMWQALVRRGRWEGEIWNRRKSGEVYPEWLSISSIPGKGQARYIAVFHDITEMKNKESQILYQANHDPLTGLPNRLAVRERLELAAARASRAGHRVAVLFVDLDDFRNVNDALGHAVGDEILVEMARRLRRLVSGGDTLARLGSDEFVLLLGAVRDESEAAQLAERVAKRMHRPFRARGHEVFLSASIGIAYFPDDGTDADEVLKSADLAMSRAKELGKNTYSLYTPQMNERVNRRIRLEGDMRRGMMRHEFEPFYQPKIDVRTGRVTGMEALIRWRREGGSLVSPGEFIPLAEETGLIVPLGEQFNFSVAAQMREMQSLGLTDAGLVVSINVSPRQFQQHNFVPLLRATLDASGLAPARFEVEITETAIMTDVTRTASTLDELRAMGLAVSIDDFGTGYSSLAYLKRFPIDTLKIDQSFVRDVTRNEADASIVATVIAMARTMGMRTVAEGVETAEQAELLARLGCDTLQGYLFSRPLPYAEFQAWLAAWQAREPRPLPGAVPAP
ncbi:sensor domain-containing protein [Desulfocurvus vexinensis]|uniref:sensor domain-containing protein n=1 Tax=Desulfocurvus vexinensis TaxID=399548 RepID=UPI0004AFB5AA|nr:bifunctional diguanylate cyclase/phosphodiesterase [Desulfocurvus vexinensis]